MVKLNLRLPNNEFHKQLKFRAEQEGISLNKLIIKVLAEYLKRPESTITQADLDQHLADIRNELAELRGKLPRR